MSNAKENRQAALMRRIAEMLFDLALGSNKSLLYVRLMEYLGVELLSVDTWVNNLHDAFAVMGNILMQIEQGKLGVTYDIHVHVTAARMLTIIEGGHVTYMPELVKWLKNRGDVGLIARRIREEIQDDPYSMQGVMEYVSLIMHEFNPKFVRL